MAEKGHNSAAFLEGDPLAGRLPLDYAAQVTRTAELCAGLLSVPVELDDDSAPLVTSFVRQLKDHKKRLEELRTAEKEPHFRNVKTIDAFFGALRESVEGAVQDLEERLAAHQAAKGPRKIAGVLGGTSSRRGELRFEVTDRKRAVAALADAIPDDVIEKAIRDFARGKKGVDLAEAQGLKGVRFWREQLARVA